MESEIQFKKNSFLNFELNSEIRKDSSNMNSGSSHVLNYRFFIMEFVYKDLNLSGSVVRWNKAIKNYISNYLGQEEESP